MSDTTIVRWILPWPRVGVNHLYVRNRGGGVRLSPAALAWRDIAIVTVRQSGYRAPSERLAFWLIVWPPADGRLHDVDNLLKLSLDSICDALAIDDSTICVVHAYRREPSPDPRLEIWLEPVVNRGFDWAVMAALKASTLRTVWAPTMEPVST